MLKDRLYNTSVKQAADFNSIHFPIRVIPTTTDVLFLLEKDDLPTVMSVLY